MGKFAHCLPHCSVRAHKMMDMKRKQQYRATARLKSSSFLQVHFSIHHSNPEEAKKRWHIYAPPCAPTLCTWLAHFALCTFYMGLRAFSTNGPSLHHPAPLIFAHGLRALHFANFIRVCLASAQVAHLCTTCVPTLCALCTLQMLHWSATTLLVLCAGGPSLYHLG